MIKINRTYSIVTPESAEQGDFAETGFDYQDNEFTFRELVELMREHPQPSCCPPSGDTNAWLSSYSGQDYRDCSETEYSIHFSRNNPPSKAKYWAKAMQFAGIIN